MSDATLVLVGNAKAGTVSVLALGETSLEVLAHTTVGAGTGTFAVDTARGLVYCATREPEPAVVTLRLDRASGDLTEIGRRGVPDALAYLALARDGELLLGASYHGGWGAAWPVADGVVGEETSRIEHANAHCVVPDSAGRYAYLVALGDDLIAQTAIDDDGVLTPLDPPTVPLDTGTGPRHLVLSGDERSAYLMTEFTGEVIRFERDPATGTLARAESVEVFDPDAGLSVSRFGADPMEEHLIWGADVHLARFGDYLLATERTASTVAVVKVEPEGLLGRVVGLVETQAQPRGFAVAPDERHVVVAGEGSGAVTLYALSDEGVLTELDSRETGAGANWVRFA
ncbi:MAG: beta-propeller fold lactonase family protein [Propionibacteriaceae bacterium]|nr:beta-propeller fold lactonase family protein [Propionibacteriaceae bacterium]